MTHTLWAASTPHFDNIIRAFRGQSRLDWGDVYRVLLVGACALLALQALILLHRLGRRAQQSPAMLFLSLCRAHRLRWSQYWQLWRLARQHRLPHAAALFLQPEWFDTPRLTALRARLFSDSSAS